jgi:hypothetical protein
MPLTPEEELRIRQVVREATHQAVSETFVGLGIDPADIDHVRQFRQNQEWVTKYRKTAERVGSGVIVSITTILTGGVMAAIWAYVTKR